MEWKLYSQMTDEQIAATCEQAADLLEGHWTQGEWVSYDDNATFTYCIEGALAAAIGIDPSVLSGNEGARISLKSCPVYQAVETTVQLHDPQGWADHDELPGWNDDEDREEHEVIDLLRATAKRVLGVPPDEYTA